MALRATRWGWSRTAWQYLAIGLLWLGHGVWVLLGPNPGRHWTSLTDVLSRPTQSLAARLANRRAARRDSAQSLVEARAE